MIRPEVEAPSLNASDLPGSLASQLESLEKELEAGDITPKVRDCQ